MAFRRPSNGRSPLVNPQRQITSFFTKSPSPSQSQSPSPVQSNPKLNPKSNPNPNSPSPSTLQPKITKKLPLVIGQAPKNPSYGEEVVNRRIRVYWPLDKIWYEGYIKSFDKSVSKHLVQYDDSEEELLDLSKEKVEILKQEKAKRFRRLRRFSIEDNVGKSKDDDDDDDWEMKADKDVVDDDSDDKDWEMKVDKDVVDDDEMVDLGLVDEEEEEEEEDVKKADFKKRKGSGVKLNSDSGKKIKTESPISRCTFLEATKNKDNSAGVKVSNIVGNTAVVGDKADRFALREEEKFKFLGKNRRDSKRRSPGDDGYDPRTLYLPSDFLNKLTGGQRQWWEFKANHMDKVLFFKMGKFYELFEMDAHVGAKELDLQYMKGDQPHCGFPEKNFESNVEKLARKGYRVLVIEQTETPEQLDKRRKQQGSKDKVVKREICAVITKGTLTDGEMMSAHPDASYLFAISECCQASENKQNDRIYGVCVADVATSKIMIGEFKDDFECSALSCLLSQLRPVEIIKPIKLLSPETEKVLLRQTRKPLVNELVPLTEFWDSKKTIHEIKEIYQRISNQSVSSSSNESTSSATNDCLPEVLSELMTAGEIGNYALSALGGTLFYLKKAFLDESLLRFAKFELLQCSGTSDFTTKLYMILDATALENLEVFENSVNGDSKGTLYDQLNRCVTAFGKRLLKAWLARPLYDINLIRERQEAVAGVKGVNLPLALEFRKELSRLPDMERLLARIFSCSEANGRNSGKVVLYEDAGKKQLQEFITVLSGCDLVINACSSLHAILENTDSRLLHRLLTPGEHLPDVSAVFRQFKDAFDWTEAKNSGRIIPREGADKVYDMACKTVADIELSLKKHLKEQRELLEDPSINYVTVGKESYLLEVPESLCGSLPRDYELQSSKKGFSRYWTPVIKDCLRELSEAESEKESKLKSIMQRLIGRFCEHHVSWRQLVTTVAELDVLVSIAIASDLYEGPTCRPLIVDPSIKNESPFLSAKNLGHPVLRNDTLGDGTFVPNDVCIGGSGHPKVILLTGPNMGGKSTLLRQVCLAVILAQVGADVPAESFKMSPIDRIFVRMGAKDHIMAGQSTFLTELLETASMLSSATHNSLVALDELGRGTATSDGQAIAASVLEHLVNKVHCRGLFSTHYHHLALDYQQTPKVSLCHMACQVGKGIGGLEEVTFLYKLTLGACPKSYGVNVARLAGLPDAVLQKAAIKSEEFEMMYGKKMNQSKPTSQGWNNDMAVILQSLRNCLVDTYSGSSADPICELQNRAKILLEQK